MSHEFGRILRREREMNKLGLREMAKMIGVSCTYLSRVERGEVPPFSERRIRDIAGILCLDLDELLASAGKISSDLVEIILDRPKEMAELIRALKGLSKEDILRLTEMAKRG
jgi:transcriptional regulator with XRE-family HTH domain